MRRSMNMDMMAAILAMGSALPQPRRTTLAPGVPVTDPETQRPEAGYCACGRRISYNKSQCLACSRVNPDAA